MFSGRPPFYIENSESVENLYDKILSGKFSFPDDKWKNISTEAKNLITEMLAFDPKDRPSAVDVLENDWFEMFGYGDKSGAKLGFDNNAYSSFNKTRLTITKKDNVEKVEKC